MANRSDRDPPNLDYNKGEKPWQKMRRGSADSIRAGRHEVLHRQAEYKTAT